MSDADLLREASDPATPGERLVEIIGSNPVLSTLTDEEKARARRVTAAAVENPSFPLTRLGAALKDTISRWCENAWRNPAMPLLLQSEASPDYEAAALRLLKRNAKVEQFHDVERVRVLAEAIALFAQRHESPTHPLARYLAGLFGLPWPSE